MALDLVTITSPSGVRFVVARSAADRFGGFLGDLEAQGYHIDQRASGGYANRNIAGTNTPSKHAYGLAIDINSNENPHANTAGVSSSNLPANIGQLAAAHGLTWGGNWTGASRDPMHFEIPGPPSGDLGGPVPSVNGAGGAPSAAFTGATDAFGNPQPGTTLWNMGAGVGTAFMPPPVSRGAPSPPAPSAPPAPVALPANARIDYGGGGGGGGEDAQALPAGAKIDYGTGTDAGGSAPEALPAGAKIDYGTDQQNVPAVPTAPAAPAAPVPPVPTAPAPPAAVPPVSAPPSPPVPAVPAVSSPAEPAATPTGPSPQDDQTSIPGQTAPVTTTPPLWERATAPVSTIIAATAPGITTPPMPPEGYSPPQATSADVPPAPPAPPAPAQLPPLPRTADAAQPGPPLQPTWTQRFSQSLKSAAQGGLLSAAARATGMEITADPSGAVDPNTGLPYMAAHPSDLPVAQEIRRREALAMMPNWYDQPTLGGKISAFTATALGTVLGGFANPESYVFPLHAGPEAGATVEQALPALLKSAGGQGAINAIVNTASQLLDQQTALGKPFSFEELRDSVAQGLGVGAALPFVGWLASRIFQRTTRPTLSPTSGLAEPPPAALGARDEPFHDPGTEAAWRNYDDWMNYYRNRETPALPAPSKETTAAPPEAEAPKPAPAPPAPEPPKPPEAPTPEPPKPPGAPAAAPVPAVPEPPRAPGEGGTPPEQPVPAAAPETRPLAAATQRPAEPSPPPLAVIPLPGPSPAPQPPPGGAPPPAPPSQAPPSAPTTTPPPAPPSQAPLSAPTAAAIPYAYQPMDVSQPTQGLTFYHGTKAPISSLGDVDLFARSNPENIVGHGLYTTDNPNIAETYARQKGQGPTGKVLAGQLGNLRLMDLEQPAHPDLINAMQEAYPDAMPTTAQMQGLTGVQLWQQFRENLKDEGITRSEASDILWSIDHHLDQQGWDGYRHEGGIQGGAKHNVVVLTEGEAFDKEGKSVGRALRNKITDVPYDRRSLASGGPGGAPAVGAGAGADEGGLRVGGQPPPHGAPGGEAPPPVQPGAVRGGEGAGPPAPPVTAALQQRVIQAALDIGGGQPNRRVLLADIRDRLPDVPRPYLDAALDQIERSGAGSLYQLDNRADITPRDRAAAFMRGGEPRHMLWLDPNVTPTAGAEPSPAPRAAPEPTAEPGPEAGPPERHVSADEKAYLIQQAQRARDALARGREEGTLSPEDHAALEDAAHEASVAAHAAVGPPPRAYGVHGASVGDHQAALDEHDRLVAERQYAEGTSVAPVEKNVYAGLSSGGTTGQQVIHGLDKQGNAWVGNGHVLVRQNPRVVTNAWKRIQGRKNLTQQEYGAGGITQVTSQEHAKAPVTWERRVTPLGNKTGGYVVGKIQGSRRVVVQGHYYDALMHSAGDDETHTIYADPKYDTAKRGSSQAPLVARNAKGETTGVAMPVRQPTDIGHIWATGKRPPSETAIPKPRAKARKLTPKQLKEMAWAEVPELKPEEREAAAQDELPIKNPLARPREDQTPAQREEADEPAPFPSDPLLGNENEDLHAPMARYAPGTQSTFNQASFTDRPSLFHQAFADMGYNPDAVVSKPTAWQIRELRNHLKAHYGFKEIHVDPKAHPRETIDTLLDAYRNAQMMAHALGLPLRAVSGIGRLSLALEPFRGKYLGKYDPGTQTIHMPGRSNSFAHEWMHAIDHLALQDLYNDPSAMALLSRETKGGRVVPSPSTPNTRVAMANLIKTMYFDKAALAARVAHLQGEASKVDAQGRPTNAAAVARRKLDEIAKGSTKLRITPTDYAAQARGLTNRDYWSDPIEMLARAGEAYVAHKVETIGGTNEFITKGDRAYLDMQDARLRATFPKDQERENIFNAMDDYIAALRNEAAGWKGQPAAPRPGDLNIIDPSRWDKAAIGQAPPGYKPNSVRAKIQKLKYDLLGSFGVDPFRPKHPFANLTRMADTLRVIGYTAKGRMEVYRDRAPKAARPVYDEIIQRAEHTVEQARRMSRRDINRLVNLFAKHQIDTSWYSTDGILLRHVMTTGDETYNGKPIPQRIIAANREIRHLLDQNWYSLDRSNVRTGYADSYFPRIWDTVKIRTSSNPFMRDAAKLYARMFEDDVGPEGSSDPEKLMQHYATLKRAERSQLDPPGSNTQPVQQAVRDLRRNLAQQAAIQAQINNGTHPDPAAGQQQIAQLRLAADKLAEIIHAPLRDLLAKGNAQDWYDAVSLGDPTDFETIGPTSRFTKARKLPGYADQMMEHWLLTDPSVVLPRYFQQTARKIAFEQNLGKGAEHLLALQRAARDRGAWSEDLTETKALVEQITGRDRTLDSSKASRVSDWVQAMGAMGMMSRAIFSSLGEPMATLAVTSNFRATATGFTNLLGDLMRTSNSKQRAEIANVLGITTSPLYESVLTDRMAGDFADTPSANKLMTNFYRMNGLTQLTNAQRRSVMSAMTLAFKAWARDLNSADPTTARQARQEFEGLGIPAQGGQGFPGVDEFGQWLLDPTRQNHPTMADIQDPQFGRMYGDALYRITNRIIQDPDKMVKPQYSSNPIGRLVYGLTGFNYSFTRNVLTPMFHGMIAPTLPSEWEQIWKEQRGAGRGRLVSALKGIQHLGGGAFLALASMAALWLAAYPGSTVREYLYNHDKWEEMQQKGQLHSYLWDMAWQRSGLNGTLDPALQAANNLKWGRSASQAILGAYPGYFGQAADQMLNYWKGAQTSPHTNTAAFNANVAFHNMIVAPLVSLAATGASTVFPALRIPAALTSMFETSHQASTDFARWRVGPKGAETIPSSGTPREPLRPPRPPPTPRPPALSRGQSQQPEASSSSSAGGAIVGLLDDVLPAIAANVVRGGAPLGTVLSNLPGPVRAAGGLAALYGVWRSLQGPPLAPQRGNPSTMEQEQPQQ